MTAVPEPRLSEVSAITTQDDAHERIRVLLTGAVGALLEEAPELLGFEDHRPQRDRSSGLTWSGVETQCHISAMLVAQGEAERGARSRERLVDAMDSAMRFFGLSGAAPIPEDPSIDGAFEWCGENGERLEVMFGVRLAVRAVSAPFLPGSLQEPRTTSPASPISPATPPPRRLR